MGEPAAAEAAAREALEINRRQLGAQHPRTTEAEGALGMALCAQRKWHEAEPFLINYATSLEGRPGWSEKSPTSLRRLSPCTWPLGSHVKPPSGGRAWRSKPLVGSSRSPPSLLSLPQQPPSRERILADRRASAPRAFGTSGLLERSAMRGLNLRSRQRHHSHNCTPSLLRFSVRLPPTTGVGRWRKRRPALEVLGNDSQRPSKAANCAPRPRVDVRATRICRS
jgi:hypothetical protein